jgi:hypothetical protein
MTSSKVTYRRSKLSLSIATVWVGIQRGFQMSIVRRIDTFNIVKSVVESHVYSGGRWSRPSKVASPSGIRTSNRVVEGRHNSFPSLRSSSVMETGRWYVSKLVVFSLICFVNRLQELLHGFQLSAAMLQRLLSTSTQHLAILPCH